MSQSRIDSALSPRPLADPASCRAGRPRRLLATVPLFRDPHSPARDPGHHLLAVTGKLVSFARLEGALRHLSRALQPQIAAISPVRRNLYITGLAGAYNKHALQAAGVDCVFCCLGPSFEFWPKRFVYHSVTLFDRANQSIDLDAYADTLHAQLQAGHSVAVHCRNGRSRSASVILAYLVKYEDLSLNAALAQLQACRAIVQPNCGFMEQLRAWESWRIPAGGVLLPLSAQRSSALSSMLDADRN